MRIFHVNAAYDELTLELEVQFIFDLKKKELAIVLPLMKFGVVYMY